MRIPKYRRHSSGRAFVEHGGKRHYLPGKYASQESELAYRKFISERFGTTRQVAPSEVTVEELVADYLDHCELYYGSAEKTEYHNLVAITRYILDFAGESRADTFGPTMLRLLRQEMIDSDLARTTVNRYVNKTVAMFKWAASHEMIPIDIYQSLKTVEPLKRGKSEARETDPVKPVDWSDVEPVLQEVNETVAAMIRLQWITGARAQNICLMSPGEIDRSSEPWVWRPNQHKCALKGHDLVIYLGPQAQKLLFPRVFKDPVFDPADHRKTKDGRTHYSTGGYAQAITRAIGRINRQRAKEHTKNQREGEPSLLTHWSPHQLRHARAQMIRDMHGLEAAQACLGHASMDATQIYARERLDLARSIAAKEG